MDPYQHHRPPSYVPPPQSVQQQQPSSPPSYYPPPMPGWQTYPSQQQQQQQLLVQHRIGYSAVTAQSYEKGRAFVFYCRMMLIAAGVLSFGGCGGMIAGPDVGRPFFGIGLLIGIVLVVVAATLGSIGRGMQGRIV